MSKWEDKVTRAAHIKKHTRGTSNEISFSVLDAAKNALDGDVDTKDHAPRFGRISLFTLPGKRKKPAPTPTKERGLPLSTGDFVSVDDVAGSSAHPSKAKLSATGAPSTKALTAPASSTPAKPKRSPEEEIARRKARRKLSKIVAVTIIVLVTIGLLIIGGLYLFREYQHQQSNVATLDSALQLVSEADETFFTLDEVVKAPFDDNSSDVRASVREHLNGAGELLNDADDRARSASMELRGAKDKEAANQTVAAISARRSLIKEGSALMDAADAAQDALDRADAAWSSVIKGDELARQAAQLVVETTAEHVEESKEKTNEALTALDAALSGFNDAQYVYPDANFSPFVEYITKRQESLGYALASDDALLAKNKEEATAQNNAYNIADAEAATLAKALPEDPSIIVKQAFEQATAERTKAYSTARLQAGSADAFIRDYLGAESK